MMKRRLAAMIVFGSLVLPAQARPGYDPMIASAAAHIVATRIGALRKGFSWHVRQEEIIEPPAMIGSQPAPDSRITGSIITLG
jgi:hypothetical protein